MRIAALALCKTNISNRWLKWIAIWCGLKFEMRAHLFSACVLRFCFASLFFGPLFLPLSWSGKKTERNFVFSSLYLLFWLHYLENSIWNCQRSRCVRCTISIPWFALFYVSVRIFGVWFIRFSPYDLFCWCDSRDLDWKIKQCGFCLASRESNCMRCVCVCVFFQPDLE